MKQNVLKTELTLFIVYKFGFIGEICFFAYNSSKNELNAGENPCLTGDECPVIRTVNCDQ